LKIKPKISHPNGQRWRIEDPGLGASGPVLLFVNRHETRTIRQLVNEYCERMQFAKKKKKQKKKTKKEKKKKKRKIGRLEVEMHLEKKAYVYIGAELINVCATPVVIGTPNF